mmetsp:Transcript_19885/g.30626  ORF Transcript_19885/g.30626 Transcript_19885/m.30626 type:complete len:88 (+) Transcript_19885:1347-1610(+)
MDKAKQKENIYNNYVDTEAIGDFEDLQLPENDKVKTIEIEYKRFHELPIKTRVDLIFYLCQTRLDQESPEFVQEVTNIQNLKRGKAA